jgi:crotonobetainyl-CoA:carnitine CoA-transferase CaiB-like acyl-CoA transferase
VSQAFEGIRIVDFSQVLAAPFAVMQLALLGAEVIKVEHPVGGDQTRGLMNTGADHGMAPSFLGMNLNKKSITVNLKSSDGVAIIKKMIESADVVVENFKAGTMEQLGLGYDVMAEWKPDLIFCSVTGYGQTGPRAGEAAYDGAIQAASGMMSQNGHKSTGPTRTGYMPVDMATALNTAFAISAALYRKLSTGLGQRIDVAMLDTAVVMQAAQFSNYLNQGNLVGLLGNASPTRQPTANVFETSDGSIQVTAIRQQQVETFFKAIGEVARLEELGFATPAARIENHIDVHAVVAQAMLKRTTKEWITTLASQGIPVAEIKSVPEVSVDSSLHERGVFTTHDSPLDNGESFTVVKAGYLLDQDGPQVRSVAPLLGQHTEEILISLGFDREVIRRFKTTGVC